MAQAIEDRIVKAPLIVHQTDKADPEKYDRASVAYAEWISIAISRWKDHHKTYGKVKKKPVLFIMAENTRDADDIYASLKSKTELKGDGQLLLIHTDKKGEIQKRDLEKAREAARLIDKPENKIRAIVSVMMLREGWDVRGVSVILGLRPFTAKANILPEQAGQTRAALREFINCLRKYEKCKVVNREPDNLSRAPEESQEKKLHIFRRNYSLTANAVFKNFNKPGLASALLDIHISA